MLGGIQIGNNVFRTVRNGKIMVVETPQGLQILRVNLETGGVTIGEDTEVPNYGTIFIRLPIFMSSLIMSILISYYLLSGVRVIGKKVTDRSRDTESWLARSQFDIYSEGAEKPYATVSEVVHTTSAISGARVCPPGPVRPLRCVHLTPQGVVIGDASYSFIEAHSAKADVLVSGTTYSTVSLNSTLARMP